MKDCDKKVVAFCLWMPMLTVSEFVLDGLNRHAR